MPLGARAFSGKMKAPVKVSITGPAGQIGYSILFRIASGDMCVRPRCFPVSEVLREYCNGFTRTTLTQARQGPARHSAAD